jgi:hypothetical protein
VEVIGEEAIDDLADIGGDEATYSRSRRVEMMLA